MKIQLRSLIILCILTIAGCKPGEGNGFAIYLLSQEMTAFDASLMDLAQLPLENEPLISGDDIASYDRADHSIELTPEGYSRFQGTFPLPVKAAGIPFVVCVGSQRIYAGALWTPASSISYDGVVILDSFGVSGTTIHLSLGYPGPDAFTGSDPRADPRILSALEQAGKLKPAP